MYRLGDDDVHDFRGDDILPEGFVCKVSHDGPYFIFFVGRKSDFLWLEYCMNGFIEGFCAD